MKYNLSIPIIVFLYVTVTCSSSQYKGVTWDKSKWKTCVCFKSKKIYGGCYPNELDAAKRVNQMCDKFGIERKNPGIDAKPSPRKLTIQHYMQGFSSQYRGVCWVKSRERWKAEIFFKSQHNVSYYLNEDDAARKVNKWCDEFKIEQKNPDVDSTPNVESKYLEILESEKLTKMATSENDNLLNFVNDDNAQSNTENNQLGKTNTNDDFNLEILESEKVTNMATSERLDSEEDDIQSNFFDPYQSTTESDEESNFEDEYLSYNENILQAQEWNQLWERQRLGFDLY